MVNPDTWSILAGPEADLVSGAHCTCIAIRKKLEEFMILTTETSLLSATALWKGGNNGADANDTAADAVMENVLSPK